MDRAFGPDAGLSWSSAVDRAAARPGARCRADHRGRHGLHRDRRRPAVVRAGLPGRGRAAGLRLTAHQGEDTRPEGIAACVDVLGAERIDHGLSLMRDPELVDRFAGERMPLTVCPTATW